MKVGLNANNDEYTAIVDIKKIDNTAQLPTRGSAAAAGYDLYAHSAIADEEWTIMPHSTVKIGTGVCVSIPKGYFGGVCARSGLATKKGLRPANCMGVVDSDYRGEVIVALHNDTDEVMTVQNGERIAQLIIMPFLPVEFNEVESLDETERGEGGFGSTGTK